MKDIEELEKDAECIYIYIYICVIIALLSAMDSQSTTNS